MLWCLDQDPTTILAMIQMYSTGHTQAVCYQLYGFPPGFERKKKNPNNTYQGRGRSNNEYHGKGRFNNDRRQNITAHNAVNVVI